VPGKHRIKTTCFSLFASFCFLYAGGPELHYFVISEYLERETRGEFLKTSTWLNNSVLNSERIPGYDTAVTISGYSIELIDSLESEPVYQITYNKIADLLQNQSGPFIKMGSEKLAVVFKLKKVKGKWLISSAIPKSHVYPKYLKEMLPKEELIKVADYLNIHNSKK